MCTRTCACVSCMPACVHAREMTVSSFSTQLPLFKRQYLFLITAAYTKLAGLAASGVVSLPHPPLDFGVLGLQTHAMVSNIYRSPSVIWVLFTFAQLPFVQ